MKRLYEYLNEARTKNTENAEGVSQKTQDAIDRIGDKKIATPSNVMRQIRDDSRKKWSEDLVTYDGETMPKEEAEKLLKKFSDNGAIDIEKPNGETIKVTKQSSRNLQRLLNKFWDEEPFFVQGEAGWAKTQIIKKMAKSEGYYVITVYLDKAEASDLGGIPVAQEREYANGSKSADMTYAMPVWGAVIRDNPDKKFLLFFDEFNQAKPDVMNALMPIILENTICGKRMPNFLVGAAGNFDYENMDGIQDIKANDALLSRFMPLIIWESDTEQAWKETFDHLHEVWDEKIGSEFIDAVEKAKKVFKNPREIEHKVIAAYFKQMKRPLEQREELVDSEWVMDKLARVGLHRETSHADWHDDELSKHLSKDSRQSAFTELTAEQQLAALSDFIADRVLHARYDEETDSVSYTTDKTIDDGVFNDDMGGEIAVDEEFINSQIIPALKKGKLDGKYKVNGKVVNLGISLENWPALVSWTGKNNDEEPRNFTAEEIEYVNNMIEEKGVKVKFKTTEDFEKLDNYMDPAKMKEEPEQV